MNSFASRAGEGGWLCGIARNLANDWRRKQGVRGNNAPLCNTDAARAAVQRESLSWLLEWYQRYSTWVLPAIIALACLPALLVPLAYCRESPAEEKLA